MKVYYNYLIGMIGEVAPSYNYVQRPDPDLDGCKKLYDDIIEVYLSDGMITDKADVTNKEQQFKYCKNRDKISINELWRRYFSLNNESPKEESSIYKPPFYTVIYKNYLLSSDYIGPSIYWAEQKGLARMKIIEILNKCRTIGGHIVWPRGCGNTINQVRGGEETFYDRIDWTLYIVKLFCDNDFDKDKAILEYKDSYGGEYSNVIKKVLDSINSYREWFKEFGNSQVAFYNFCKQFKLIGSFVNENLDINWLSEPFPFLTDDYLEYANNNINAIEIRNEFLIKIRESNSF